MGNQRNFFRHLVLLDTVKQAASALASALHRAVNFKPKTRSFAIGVFDEDMINTPRTSIQNRCVFKDYQYHFDAG